MEYLDDELQNGHYICPHLWDRYSYACGTGDLIYTFVVGTVGIIFLAYIPLGPTAEYAILNYAILLIIFITVYIVSKNSTKTSHNSV